MAIALQLLGAAEAIGSQGDGPLQGLKRQGWLWLCQASAQGALAGALGQGGFDTAGRSDTQQMEQQRAAIHRGQFIVNGYRNWFGGD